MNQYTHNLSYRRNLPHIQPPGASFFITFNLSGSIPKHVIQQYISEKRTLEIAKQPTLKQNQVIQEKKREWFRKFDKLLDQADIGPVWLKNEQIAELVSKWESIFFDFILHYVKPCPCSIYTTENPYF